MTARSDSLYKHGAGVALVIVVLTALLAVSADACFADDVYTSENCLLCDIPYIPIACSW